jgi:hypothetical protein
MHFLTKCLASLFHLKNVIVNKFNLPGGTGRRVLLLLLLMLLNLEDLRLLTARSRVQPHIPAS